MPVLMTLRVHGDPARLEENAAAHPERMRAITDRARQHGLRSHHFYGGDGEILVVDEWESEEGFHQFFEASPEIADMMRESGVTEQPESRFWRPLETHDAVEAPMAAAH